MTWTYLPAAMRNLDRVRLLIGDTDSADPQLQDEEITFFLTEAGNPRAAAVQAVEALIGRYARQVDRAIGGEGGLSVSASQKVAHYQQLLVTLKERARSRPVPFAGGISQSQKDAQEERTDRVRPAFTVDMDSAPVVLDEERE